MASFRKRTDTCFSRRTEQRTFSNARCYFASALLLLLIVLTLPTMVQMKYLGPKLSRLVMDEQTGVVFVGGENRLYQLTDGLKLLVEVKTGPMDDSDKCFPPPEACFVNRTATNNYNKILVVDKDRRNLIACGSVYQGKCEARSLMNISDVLPGKQDDDMINFAVVANDETSSSEAFIARGLPQLGTVMYVASTYSGKSPESQVYREQVPAIATRSLNRRNRFSLTEGGGSFSESRVSAIFIKSEVAPQYPIQYVTGFSSGNFSYFLTVQRDTVSRLQHGKLLTKIVQICHDDAFYYSYSDIPLRCASETPGAGIDEDYNVLQAARVIYPGEQLAENLFADNNPGDVLVGVFTRDNSQTGSGRQGTFGAGNKHRRSGPSSRGVDSAVCVFTMAEIRRKFLENIKLCHQGNSSVSGGGYLRVGPRGNCNQQLGKHKKETEQDEENKNKMKDNNERRRRRRREWRRKMKKEGERN
ncbi:H(+)/cl(-) exchange transporter 3-like [Plakobranchus ocellatus]|uniref:H(+)/cl(-) exchange transporter 3-like n=1 Tax=Plakobranchus ocellatus TaxID=259542 RepID=A0AAV4AJ22_9GAST|nr:H(+)/cl(-) exchange transporter 3-like [Plakobranchus ocellatus]